VGFRIFLVCAVLVGACSESTNNTGGSGGAGGSGGDGGSGGFGGGIVSDLEVTTFISGLDKPWDIAWLPNGTVVVTERAGRLNVYVDGVDAPPFTVAPSDLIASGEGGMMGLEVDPDFNSNGYVYVCMGSNASGPTDVRVVRFTLRAPDGDEVLDRDDIVTGMPYSTGRHSGCRPRFGPDGYLWVGTGDAAVGVNPQDDNSLGGKVLRIDRDGAAAPGNPGGYRWFSKGHRNIQGMAFRSSDDVGVSAEHGPSIDDEINLLVAGNFGWDPVPGYTESVPMTDLVKFPNAVEAIWSTGDPTLAFSGAGFIEGTRWGDWDGVLAVATLRAEHLHIYVVTSEGEVTDDFRVIEDEGRLRSPRQGPDGLLYVTNDGRNDAGQVLRVTPVLSPLP
jgi:glucose/arabinose dehydrogenase